MRYIIGIFFVLALESAWGADKFGGPDFSNYPQTKSFRYYLNFHNALGHLERKDPNP